MHTNNTRTHTTRIHIQHTYLQVVEAIVTSLQELEQAETARLDVEAVGVLEKTLTRMTALYAQHGQLDLAVDTSRKHACVILFVLCMRHLSGVIHT